MLNMIRIVCVSLIVIAFFNAPVQAQEWRKIVPLHYTRTQVKELLGKPLFEEPASDIYDVEEGRLNIMYVHQPCEQGLPADWGNWNVPVGTVVNMFLYLKKDMRLSDLNIPDIEKLKWYTDDTFTTYFMIKRKEFSTRLGATGASPPSLMGRRNQTSISFARRVLQRSSIKFQRDAA